MSMSTEGAEKPPVGVSEFGNMLPQSRYSYTLMYQVPVQRFIVEKRRAIIYTGRRQDLYSVYIHG